MNTRTFWDAQYSELLEVILDTLPVTDETIRLARNAMTIPAGTQTDQTDTAGEESETVYEKLKADEKARVLAKTREALRAERGESEANPALEYLSARFSLDRKLERLVIFFFLYDRYTEFQEWLYKQKDSSVIALLMRFTGMERNELVEAMKADSPLSRGGLLDPDCSPSLKINRHNVNIALGQYISYYLDDTHARSLASFVLESPAEADLPLGAFELPDETVASALAVFRKEGRGILLLYGEPGTGKTELSKRISLEASRRPCFLKTDATMIRSWSKLLIAAKMIDPDREVLIVDEAETLLSTPFNALSEVKKASLVQFLDDYDKKLILIVNDTSGIGNYTLRRIDSFIAFKPHTRVQRERVWEALDRDEPVFTGEQRQRLALEFPANPARVRQVRDICAVLARENAPRERIDTVARDLLSRGIEAMSGTPWRACGEESDIDIGLLSPSLPATEILERLRRWRNETERSKTGGNEGSGLNLLFYGLPGTGKTAFATYLARNLGIVPIIKRASDLLDPFVGMTERHIQNAFEEAKDGALIIDEADSFLGDRSRATKSWERTQVNEFLTRMERFTGLFIATTNLTSVLDSASRIRFHFKVEFGPATAGAKRDLAKRFFPGIDWTEDTLALVSLIEGLTPGDFNAVSERLRYAGTLTARDVCEELKAERAFGVVDTRIGFYA